MFHIKRSRISYTLHNSMETILLKIVIKTIVDNTSLANNYLSAWGLSLYLEVFGDHSHYALLFDVDGHFRIWRYNALSLGIDLAKIDAIVISHWHLDHAGPLREVLKLIGRNTPIYVPCTPKLRRYSMLKNIIMCSKPCRITRNIITSGAMGNGLAEQALIIDRGSDLVIVVGCSHHGIENIVERAYNITEKKRVKLVIGGLHIFSGEQGLCVARKLMDLGVEGISPMHCTGINAKSAMREIYGEKYIPNGSGKVIVL